MTDGLAALLGLEEARVTRLLHTMADRRLTVAAAESLTGGLFSALLTEIPGSSAVVRGALVVYATDLKASVAGVDDDLLARRGPVDPEVAAQLARGARRRCGASVGVGLTGVAGPDQQGGFPVGTFYIAVAGPEDQLLSHFQDGAAGPALSRAQVRAHAVGVALELLERLVLPSGGNS